MATEQKEKADRLREGITILKKLREFGIFDVDPSFKEIQKHISAWVSSGEEINATVHMWRQGRIAELELPVEKGKVAALLLKVDKNIP